MGVYICSDEETSKLLKLDMARFLIRMKSSMVLNQVINVEINEHVYRIKMVEDMHGP